MISDISVETKGMRFMLDAGVTFTTKRDADGAEHELKLNIVYQDMRRPPFESAENGKRPMTPYVKPIPAVIYFTGGGFMMTDNVRKLPVLNYFTTRGYAVIMAEYRVGEEGRYPRSVLDAQEAVDYVRRNAAHYGIDSDRLALMGDSAGAYLALMAGYSCKGVRAVCDLFGLADMEKLRDDETVINYLALSSDADNKRKCLAASPISHICDDTPPTIILHGDADTAVPPEQSLELHDELERQGIPVELIRVKSAQHVGAEFDQPEVLSRIADFFDTYVRDAEETVYDDEYLIMG